MGHATQEIQGGQLVGYDCEYGHLHGTSSEAQGCDPEKYAKAQRAKLDAEESARIKAIREDARFDPAVEFVDEQFGVKDQAVSEQVVIALGIKDVFAVKDALAKAKAAVKQAQAVKKKGADDKDDKDKDGKGQSDGKGGSTSGPPKP